LKSDYLINMHPARVIGQIIECGIVAVVRSDSSQQAVQIGDACLKGGVTVLEITFTTPGAANAIETLRRQYSSGEMLIGAGTVLDPETARIAILSGAQFIVAPNLSSETARLCSRYQVPYVPGAQTIGEIVAAMETGASIVKVFPGEVLGPAFIKAVHGPLPQAALMPTGGVTLENARQWIEAGSVALGVGSNLTRTAKTGDFATITKLAKEFARIVRSARKSESA
jgi:2-dehydro-3-deoxyphosphogluconate aldolase / (4S)-4-hydroxy-2-oxoglutarate aldolase